MSQIEFVGGSKDGAVMEVHPAMNHILEFPIDADYKDSNALDAFKGTPLAGGMIKRERYEYKQGRFHFIGYR